MATAIEPVKMRMAGNEQNLSSQGFQESVLPYSAEPW
jgi:hypothetical protein